MSNKCNLLYIYQILVEETDENHRLTRSQFNEKLEKRYNCTVSRKTFYAMIQSLQDFGYEIYVPTSKQDGYYLLNHLLEPSEVEMLCNAVYASRFITEKHSNELIKKILSTQCKNVEKNFHKKVYMKNNRKSKNVDFFLNLEIINEAIQQNHPIEFDYYQYNIKKTLVKRREKKYRVHPYNIVCSNDNFYLICRHEHHDNFSNYRLDRIRNIKIDDKVSRINLLQSFDPYDYAKTKLFMYGGEEKTVKLRCTYRMLDDIIEQFGDDVRIYEEDENHFTATIHASSQGIIYFCLQYLMNCEILQPLELRNRMNDILQEAQQRYLKDIKKESK